eukprot:CAMPEP_0198121376 /NCGR_PEP_ID=MMETSP1442-20131203/31920_1 /TAXON_ID= /ORGANISM="Craspedostauros australis, Strain CCMP3328" /LENGTH=111 /DNA_ID=CAMNT_0043780165 /DNA_START=110 /DNA_END=445 /DNA_ORIENTATION=-
MMMGRRGMSWMAIAAIATIAANGFQVQPQRCRSCEMGRSPVAAHRWHTTATIMTTSTSKRWMSQNDDEESSQDAAGFDGKGFAGYLAPYALTLVLSVAATAAFVKFVLMDY